MNITICAPEYQISPETLPTITWQEARVITTELLARLYGAAETNIHDNYRKNVERFVEGKHFFKLEGESLREFKKTLTGNIPVSRIRHLTLWTERGAARHAKMLNTEAAWDVFEKLEDCYFQVKETLESNARYVANPRDVLTASQAEQLRVAMRENCDKLPKGQQGSFNTKGWSRLKSHFGVTYRNIPQFELTEALSMIGRHAADWEIVEPAALPAPEKTVMNESLRHSISSLAIQMLWLRSWWTANGPAIKAINGEMASTIHDRFIDGAIFADGLGCTIGQEFPEEYIKNYPWRGTEQDREQYRRTKSH